MIAAITWNERVIFFMTAQRRIFTPLSSSLLFTPRF